MRPRKRFPLESWVLLFPPPDTQEPLVPAEPPVKQRGFTLLAWLAIIVLVTFIAGMQAIRPYLEEILSEEVVEKRVDPETPPRPDAVSAALNKLQIRYMIGAHSFLRQGGEEFLKQLQPLLAGTFEEQLQYAIYAGELKGPKAALQALSETRQEHSGRLTEERRTLLDILQRLYTDYVALRLNAPSVNPAEQDLLAEKLGWAGELALVPDGVPVPSHVEAATGAPLSAGLAEAETPDPAARSEVLAPAHRTFATTFVGFSGALCLAFIGAVGLLIIGLLVANRQITSRLGIERGNSGIYAETFALWLLLFVVLAIVPRLVFPDAPVLLLSLVTFVLSMVALLWPVARGIPWSTVRQEIGWTSRRPLVEVLWGFAWYVMSLPFLLIGVMITLFLFFLRGLVERGGIGDGAGMPTGREAAHPIVGEIATADPLGLLMIFLLASVAAPIIEETFFRGVLYRHVREATGRWGGFLSILLSALLVSFIFAVIHPQGLLAVPVLMGLAMGFTLAREARGSLIPCMVAHGVSNGLVLLASVLMLRG